MTRDERAKCNRDYFEVGCLCIHEGSLEKLSASVPDVEAAEYYEKNCQCSRNYVEKHDDN